MTAPESPQPKPLSPVTWASYVALTRGTLTFKANSPELYQRHVSTLFLGSLLRAIAQHARYPSDGRGDPFAFVGVEKLATITRSSPRYVRIGLRELERQGLIVTQCGGGWIRSQVGRANTYTLQIAARPAENLPGNRQQRGGQLPGNAQQASGELPGNTQQATRKQFHPNSVGTLTVASYVDQGEEGDRLESASNSPNEPLRGAVSEGAANSTAPPAGGWAQPGSAAAAARGTGAAGSPASGPALVRQALADAKRNAGRIPEDLSGGSNRAERRRAARDARRQRGDGG